MSAIASSSRCDPAHCSPGLFRSLAFIVFTLVLSFSGHSPAFAEQRNYYWNYGSDHQGLWYADSFWTTSHGWTESKIICPEMGQPCTEAHTKNKLWTDGNHARFAKYNAWIYPTRYDVHVNKDWMHDSWPGVYQFEINNSSYGGNYSFQPSGFSHASIAGMDTDALKRSPASVLIHGSTSENRYTASFTDVDLLHFPEFTVRDYDSVVFTGSSVEATNLYLRDHAVFTWNGARNAQGLYPQLRTSGIGGEANATLNLNVPDSANLQGVSLITGSDSRFTVRVTGGSSGSSTLLPPIMRARVFVDGGAVTFSRFVMPGWYNDTSVAAGAAATAPRDMAFNSLTVDGTFHTAGGLYTPSLSGNGEIHLYDNAEFFWAKDQGNGSASFDDFTGRINLNGNKLVVGDPILLGKASRIDGYGMLDIATSANGRNVVSSSLYNTTSGDLIFSTHGPRALTLAATGLSSGEALRKQGTGELALSGGTYSYSRGISIDDGTLNLADGVQLSTPQLYVGSARVPKLRISGEAFLNGNLQASSSTVVLDGGSLHVAGNTQFNQYSNFDYRGGLLTVSGRLDLGGSRFSANLPHPGVFVVTDYGSLGSRFGNASADRQDVSYYVKMQDQAVSHPVYLSYMPNNRAVLAAPNGQNLLYYAGGGAMPGYAPWNGEAYLANWLDLSDNPHTWDNSKMSSAIFDHSYSNALQVTVANHVSANMLSFLDGGWRIASDNYLRDNIILHPFSAQPDSEFYFTVLNSQSSPKLVALAPRLELPVQVSDPSVPLWKTGAGDLVLAADASTTSPGGYRPENVFIREGRLILEHNAALKDALITLSPESSLALNWKTGGTGNELLNTIAGTGSLEVRADTNITTPNAEFWGDVSVNTGATLTVSTLEALGKELGLSDIALSLSAQLRLAYDDADNTLPRGVSGEGGVAVAANTAAKLASGNSYSGGTTVENAATLTLEGPGAGEVFSAAGEGAITLDNAATLRLEDGGIMRNKLSGAVDSTLKLDGMHVYTLEDNNLRSGFGGAVVVEAALGVLRLAADSVLGDALAPSFAGIGGAGSLLLEGGGVTFDFTGLTNNSYAGATVLGKETSLKLSGDYSSGQVGTGRIALQGDNSELLLAMGGGTFGNALSGAGRLSLDAGTYRLSGDNSLFGGSIRVPGTLLVDAQREIGQTRLLLGDGATLTTQADALSNTIELTDGSATLNTVSDLHLRGAITGEGGLVKSGSGMLTLAYSDYNYSGSTSVSGGTLRLDNAYLSGGGALTVGSGATLAGMGDIAGNTTVNGAFSVDGLFSFSGERDQDGNLLQGTDLALGSGSKITFNNGGWLDVSGALDWNVSATTNTVNLDSLGVYVLARYGSSTLANGVVDKSDYTVNYEGADITGDPNYRLSLTNNAGQKDVLLMALPTGQRVEFWNSASGLWNADGAASWNSLYDASGLTETWASDSRIAVFGTDPVTPGAVTVQGTVDASGLFFLSSGWNITGGSIGLLDLDPLDARGSLYAVLSGQEGDILIDATLTDGTPGMGLHKSGAGRIILDAANSYTGDTWVTSGTLALADIRAAGYNPLITVEEEAILELAYYAPTVGLPQTVTGQGMLKISGDVLLDKANTHSGGTRIALGSLRLADADALGTGSLLFNNGLLSMVDSLDVRNDVALEGGVNIVTVAEGESVGLSGDISGNSLRKIGAGELVLSGDSTFTGGLYLDQGRLIAASDTAFGYGTVRMARGGTLGFSGDRALANDFSLNGVALFEVADADSGVLNGIIHGTGDLLKIGEGTLTLGGANEYAGWTDVWEGTLALATAGGKISDQLSVRGGATFDTGGNEIQLGALSAHWQSSYTGDLDTEDGTMLFTLPASVRPHGVSILQVDGRAEIGGSLVALDLGGRDRTDLLPGHVLTLIQTSGGIDGLPANHTTTGRLGITRAYEANLWTDTNALYAGVTHLGASPESKALSEGFLAGLALVNQGGDLVSGQGMAQARQAAQSAEQGDLAAFGVVAGGWSRYNSGSHVEMSSVSLMTGVARGAQTKAGRLTLGAFFEYGNGSYDTHNSFTNTASVDGDGDSYYTGGGLLGHMDFGNTGQGRWYAEASGRMGKMHTGYNSADLRDSHTGVPGNYDSSSLYYGVHLGAGYRRKMSEAASLDLYGKYLWTRQQGDSVTLANGDPVTFKDADSQRLRLGGRFTYSANDFVSPYVGVAWEHEFAGKARAATYGYGIDAPSLRGDTGIGEIGLTVTPSETLPLSLDLGVQGYAGKREGVTGSVQVRFAF